jgi:hypothetical protein
MFALSQQAVSASSIQNSAQTDEKYPSEKMCCKNGAKNKDVLE